MKFTISNEQRYYFNANGFIEFASVMAVEQIKSLNTSIHSIIQGSSSHSNYVSGRDMWRKEDTVRRQALKRQYAEIAAELTESPLVRIAFDQYIPPHYASIVYQNPSKIEPTVCFKDLLCILLFRLDPASDAEEGSKLLMQLGNALFIKPTQDIDWKEDLEECSYYMIGYGNKETKYRLNDHDPCTHELKHMGYSIGSFLQDKLHPPLYPHR